MRPPRMEGQAPVGRGGSSLLVTSASAKPAALACIASPWTREWAACRASASHCFSNRAKRMQIVRMVTTRFNVSTEDANQTNAPACSQQSVAMALKERVVCLPMTSPTMTSTPVASTACRGWFANMHTTSPAQSALLASASRRSAVVAYARVPPVGCTRKRIG